MPDERIHDCLRKIIPGKRTVDVIYDPARKDAHYKNLMTCGSVWHCAVCAGRITEQRAAELLQAVTRWQAEGGFIALLTFTLRHNRGDKLSVLLDAIRDSHSKFKSGASWYRFADQFNWHGSVTALEVTHGANGWHPHLHELVFFEPLSRDTWRTFPDKAKGRWIGALASSGRDATWSHGLDVRDADSEVYDYVAKFGHLPTGTSWTLEREVAKAPVKKARSKDGRSPFQLLIDYGEGDLKAAALFQEYARTFKGRKQLVWSKGLRSELGLNDDPSDDELAAALPDEYILLASLEKHQWRAILALGWAAQAELLDVASHGDKNAVDRFLTSFGIA